MSAAIIRLQAGKGRRRGTSVCRQVVPDPKIVRRLREIGNPTLEELIASDGEAHSDAKLLDLAGEALSLIAEAQYLLDAHGAALARCIEAERNGPGFLGAPHRAEPKRLMEAYWEKVAASRTILHRVRKIRASTAAGIYAKALLVRHSRTGAPVLAASLAQDLIEVPALRASIWPAD